LSSITRWVVAARGWWAGRAFERAVRDPEAAQAKFLRNLLKQNGETAFARDHGFAEITTAQDYRERVPLRDYEEHKPYIDRMIAGEERVLTKAAPFMYGTTSGTTASPKLIPVNLAWKKGLASLLRLWISRCQATHPGMLRHRILTLTSPAVEDYTEKDVPIGSVSGLTQKRAPKVIRKNLAVPYQIAEIQDYDLRYALTMRYAFANSVSTIVTPNPSTILKLAEVGVEHGEAIVRAVRDGTLGFDPTFYRGGDDPKQVQLLKNLESKLKPDPRRASFLQGCMNRRGVLLPKDAWPHLSVIGCWLGGSCGVQTRRLKDYFPKEIPFRDLGLRATEATVTIPLEDGTASGVLAVHGNYYEFIPEEEIDAQNPRALGSHELEVGKSYYLILTTSAGLYRYDINDVVEVQGYYHKAPIIAFLRKGRDMVNITGEKLHINQVLNATGAAAQALDFEWRQLQIIPNVEESRYDFLLEPMSNEVSERTLSLFLAEFDRQLTLSNMEYQQKRRSHRLAMPQLYRMKVGWSERKRFREISLGGKRDAQYKWPMIQQEWDDLSRDEIFSDHSARTSETDIREITSSLTRSDTPQD
jgi:hypothetical protein